MDLSKLSLEEALKLGIITRGSWNNDDYEPFDFDREKYQKVFAFAKQKHTECRSIFVTDIRTGESVPYITVIENTLNILSKEAHICDYTAWRTVALYNITVKTDCKLSVLEKLVEYEVCTNINALVHREFESLEEYINRCMNVYEKSNHDSLMLICVLLATELAKQRLIKYPFNSWEEDSPYYFSLIKQLEPFIEVFKKMEWKRALWLTEKLLKQLMDNRTRSLNMNKTADELYASSSNDDGEWTTVYTKTTNRCNANNK